MNNPSVQLARMVIASAVLSSVLFIAGAEAREKQHPTTTGQFLTYCETPGVGKSATDPQTGKYYCCLTNDESLLGNKCITCDVDRSGNKSNCITEKRVPRGRFQPPMKNTNGDMAPVENPSTTRYPPSPVNGSSTQEPVVIEHRKK
jgi:hypothetical protein